MAAAVSADAWKVSRPVELSNSGTSEADIGELIELIDHAGREMRTVSTNVLIMMTTLIELTSNRFSVARPAGERHRPPLARR